MSSSPTSGMFSLQVLIILGITVALVSAVAVILYNKIQQQGEKISAVMELSTVIAQELRSHDTVLQHLQSRDNPTFVGSSPPHVGQSGSVSQSGYSNIVLSSPENNNDSMLVYVSDGSCNSSDDESDNEGKQKISQIPSTTLDNMLMNPMCFGHPSPPDIIDSESDESGENIYCVVSQPQATTNQPKEKPTTHTNTSHNTSYEHPTFKSTASTTQAYHRIFGKEEKKRTLADDEI